MSPRGVVAVAALLGWLAAGLVPAAAFIPVLSDKDVETALDVGEKSIAQADFDDEWRVPLPDGFEIEVATPFYRVASAARRASFKNEPLADKDRDEAIERGKGKVQLKVTLVGPSVNFARWYTEAVLVAGRQEVKATFVQPEHTALKLPDNRWAARNIFVFPVEGLPAKGTVILVVRHRIEKKEVWRAPIDLSKMR
jgi:hypothetical protein